MKSRRATFLLSFFLPAIILCACLIRTGITPFGPRSLLISDMNSQYIDFLAEYRRALTGHGGLLYNWHTGMGMSFPAVIAYYLASPFNFLLILFPESEILNAVTFLTVLKLSCAGLSIAFFLKRRFGECSYLPLFALFYALSGYSIAYAFNIMWLDALIWLPLICFGIEELLDNKRLIFLTIFFCASFISHFYTAWMTGLFAVLYFISRLIHEKSLKDTVKQSVRFALSVGFAAGCSTFLLLPTYLTLKNNMGLIGQTIPAWTAQFTLWQLPRKLFIGSFDWMKDCLPHIYCGLPALIGFILYLINRSIPKRERVCAILILFILVISFLMRPLDFFWHAMDVPSWFPYRYAFLLSFMLLICAYEGFQKSNKPIYAIASVLPMIGAVILLRGSLLWLNLAFLIIYTFLLLKPCHVTSLILITICTAEAFLNTQSVFDAYKSSYTLAADYKTFTEGYQTLSKAILPQESDFYRIEKSIFRTYNDPMGIGFPGISHFSSTASVRQSEFLKKLGFDCYATWCTHDGATPASDALLDVRYVMSEDSITENTAALPLFFFADERFARIPFATDALNPIQRQNQLLMQASATEQAIFTPATAELMHLQNAKPLADGGFTRLIPNNPAYAEYRVSDCPDTWLYMPGFSLNANVIINGKPVFAANRNYTPFLINLTDYTNDDSVIIRIEPSGEDFHGPIQAYHLDRSVFEKASTAIRNAAPSFRMVSDTRFEVTFTSSNDERLLVTSIPFDSGWQIKANGNALPVRMIHEGLLGCTVPANISSLDVNFTPYGMREGLLISAVSVLSFCVLQIITRKRKTNI